MNLLLEKENPSFGKSSYIKISIQISSSHFSTKHPFLAIALSFLDQTFVTDLLNCHIRFCTTNGLFDNNNNNICMQMYRKDIKQVGTLSSEDPTLMTQNTSKI